MSIMWSSTCRYSLSVLPVGAFESSIRIPAEVNISGKGYLEDRRPASNADPYKIVSRIIQTMKMYTNSEKVGV